MSHAGNWQRNPRKLSLERARSASSEDADLAGWRAQSGRLTAVRTPAALLARKALYEGRCSLFPECTRRVTANLAFFVAHGFGEMALEKVETLYQCGRLTGCELRFRESYPGGVPLISLLNEGENLRIRFHCGTCKGIKFQFLVGDLIARLKRQGRGDGNTGCGEVAKPLTWRCPVCGPVSWTTSVERPAPLFKTSG